VSKGKKIIIVIIILCVTICVILGSVFLVKYNKLKKEMIQIVKQETNILSPELKFDGIELKTGYKIARFRVVDFENYVVSVAYDERGINHIGVKEEKDG